MIADPHTVSVFCTEVTDGEFSNSANKELQMLSNSFPLEQLFRSGTDSFPWQQTGDVLPFVLNY